MLKNLSAEIREYYEHADLELRWLFPARSGADFSNGAKRRAEGRHAKN
jgi:hypothetical protein